MNLFKRSSHRTLLIDFKGLTVFELFSGVLHETRYFSAEDSGYTDFRNYLADTPPTPLVMIVDSIAEDFYIETIAHVMVTDRKDLLKRKLDQHYRGIDYRHALVIGREASGRRDDKVLFSALTRNQQIDPWIRCILKEEVPLRSISSPAYIFGHYLKEQGYLTSAHLLVVHWELSGVRQTYLLNGRTVFSRLTPLPSGDNAKPLSESIMELCSQSREYLEAVKLLEPAQALDIQIFSPLLDDEAFAGQGGTATINQIAHHNTNQLLDSNQFLGSAEQVTAILLCIDFAARREPPLNIYAPSVARRFYHLKLARQAIYSACIVMLMAGFLLAAPIFDDALGSRDRAARLFAQAEPVNAQYQALREQFPETPIPSQAMELAVTTFNLVQGQAQSPNNLLIQVSQVLAEFPNISLSRIEWRLNSRELDGPITQSLLDDVTSVGLVLQGNVTGVVGFQRTDQQIRDFSAALEAIPYIQVTPQQLPIENSAQVSVNTTVDDQQTASFFILNLTMERSQ
ncbi:MAG: hypothetical protein WD772_03235 [Pseudohongiellaceae bacterium]